MALTGEVYTYIHDYSFMSPETGAARTAGGPSEGKLQRQVSSGRAQPAEHAVRNISGANSRGKPG